jgi:hypothetical protein
MSAPAPRAVCRSLALFRRYRRNWIGCSVLVALSSLGCGASSGELYERGMASYGQKQPDAAAKDLTAFTEKGCGPSAGGAHCRKAYLTLGAIYEGRQAPGRAWAAYESALGFPPHDDDVTVQVDVDRSRMSLVDGQQKASARAPVIVRYRDEVTDEYNPRSVTISLDQETILNKDKDASEFHTPEFHRVYGGSVPVGEHVVTVEMVHDCKAGGGVRCARSHVRKSWPFDSVAHTPATIEIRAYAEEGAGDAPARPTLELLAR